MKNKKSTKRALISSILSLALCMTMLIGTTFAWFTDSVTSANNKIQAGKLDVELYLWNTATDSERISTKVDPIFGAAGLAQNDASATLWEPGKTQVVYLSIKNEGTLDLKYKVAIDVNSKGQNLWEVMEYAITPDATYGTVGSWDKNAGVEVVPGINATAAEDVALKAGEEHFFALSVHMLEEAGNEYQGKEVEFDIRVLAGQLASEEDSFGSDYDTLASYPGKGFAQAPAQGVSAVEIPIRNEADAKVGSVVIPAEATTPGAELVANIEKTEYNGNFTIANGMEKESFDIKVDGLNANNDVPVTVQVRMPVGKNPGTFKLYHYDEEIPCTYNAETGYVKFSTTSFSPFTIVYDADSVYVAPEEDENKLPTATVTKKTEYENVTLPWGSYGQWSPTPGLSSNLEAAYEFKCTETLEEAKENPYANWYCDFYVVLDKDLGENQIFLGGNYGSFGWVGFHNGDMTLEANTEIGLLESVTTNPWTYLDVVQYVDTFTCGVGDVNNALSGATFKVMLRLTNPADATDFVNVETIEYKF